MIVVVILITALLPSYSTTKQFPTGPVTKSTNWILSESFTIQHCDVRVFYEISCAREQNYNFAEQTLKLVPVISHEFHGVPFKPLSVAHNPNDTGLVFISKTLYNCKIIFVFHSTPSEIFSRKIDISGIKNPLFLSHEQRNVRIETGNSYIILANIKNDMSRVPPEGLIAGLQIKSFKSRMNSLRRQHLKVGLHEANPHYFQVFGKKYGTGYEFIVALAKSCDFNYTLSTVPLQVTKLGDGTLSGWENEVKYGRIDVEIFYVPNYVFHHPNLDYTTPIWKAAIIYIAKVPGYRTKWTTISRILEPTTWLALGVVTFAFSLAAYVKERATAQFYGQKPERGSTILFLVFNCLVSQSVAHIPKTLRGLAVLWMLCSVVMTNYFCSFLLSLLTFPIPSEHIPKDMVEVEQRSEYDVLALDHPGGPLEDYFTHTTTPHLVNIWQRTTLCPMDLCVLKAITTPKTVCLGWDFLFEAILEANASIREQFSPAVCIDASLITVYHSVIMRKNVPYADVFNEAVGWYRDTGIYQAWLKQVHALTKKLGRAWMNSPPQAETELFQILEESYRSSIKSGAEPLEIIFMVASLVILLCGCIVAFVVFVGELFSANANFVVHMKPHINEVVLPFGTKSRRYFDASLSTVAETRFSAFEY